MISWQILLLVSIISELSDCREDERHCQTQIIQIIVAAGALLGILLGASYFGDSNNVTSLAGFDNTRITFFLSLLVFCAAFTYIATFGIGSVLRYYHIQVLEDRLHMLLPSAANDSQQKKAFVHWESYTAPIITRNPLHIASGYTAIYFVFYSIAACGAIAFSILLIFVQFSRIESKEWYDYAGLVFALTLIFVVIVIFAFTSSKGKQMADFARNTAESNRKEREKNGDTKSYQGSKGFRHIIRYFIYPKVSDLQKPLLIVAGFVLGLILSHQAIKTACIGKLAFTIFVFDILAYQARFQINDLRGIKEDNNRFIYEGDDQLTKTKKIKQSMIIAVLKIIAALGLTIFLGGSVRLTLIVCLLLLLAFTIAYEAARKKNNETGTNNARVFIFVGSGYPLRFFLGLFVAFPDLFSNVSVMYLLFLAVAFWAYGSYSAVLSWAIQVLAMMKKEKSETGEFPKKYIKKHFALLQDILEQRYKLAEDRQKSKLLPLRESGKFTDPWNVAFLLAVICIPIIIIFVVKPNSIWIIVTEIAAFLLFIFSVKFSYGAAWIFMGLGWILTFLVMLIAHSMEHLSLWIFCLCVIQYIFTITYQAIRYAAPFDVLSWLKLVKAKFVKWIVGDATWEIMYSPQNDINTRQRICKAEQDDIK